ATQMTPTEQIRARADLAWLLARLEQPAAATETAQSVLASTVADAECLEVAGLALLIAGQAQTAIDALRRALDGSKGAQAAARAFHLGEALLVAGRWDEAATAFERCGREDPRSLFAPRAQERLSQLAQQRPYR